MAFTSHYIPMNSHNKFCLLGATWNLKSLVIDSILYHGHNKARIPWKSWNPTTSPIEITIFSMESQNHQLKRSWFHQDNPHRNQRCRWPKRWPWRKSTSRTSCNWRLGSVGERMGQILMVILHGGPQGLHRDFMGFQWISWEFMVISWDFMVMNRGFMGYNPSIWVKHNKL